MSAKTLARMLAIGLALLIVAAAHAASYEDLLAQAKRDPASTDLKALRYAYAASSDHDPDAAAEMELRSTMMRAFNDKDCDGAIKKAQAILEKNYVSIDAHIALDLCYRQLDQADKAKPHELMARGLIRSVLEEGDGKTPKTAYAVISISEEYSVIDIVGMTKVKQALISADGHRYDRLTVRNKSGETVDVYFNIDRLYGGWKEK